MPSALVIAPELVRQEWDVRASWSDTRAAREAKRFRHNQPAVVAYVYAMLDDESLVALNCGLEVAHTIDRAYRRAVNGDPACVSEGDMEVAAEETVKCFSDLTDMEPALAFRRLFFQRDLAAPAVVTELLAVLMELGQEEPQVEAALGALFIATLGVAKAYERAHGMAAAEVPKLSIGDDIEARSGRPLPKVGGNDPCPCGSGRKFKKCCGLLPPPPPPKKSHAEELFSQYIAVTEQVWSYLDQIERDPAARWLRQRLEAFERRYHPGAPEGIPDSLHVSHGIFDLAIPRCGKSMGALFLERKGHRLDDTDRQRAQDLCDSYHAFYEVVELCPTDGKKRLRELVSGTEWVVNDIEDPDAEIGTPGEIFLCRLVGARGDAVIFASPLIYPPQAHSDLEDVVHACIDSDLASGLPLAEAMRAGMKRAGELLADYILATSPEWDNDEENGLEDGNERDDDRDDEE